MSSQSLGAEVDVSVVNGRAHDDGGVAHGTRLVAFVDAVMAGDEARLADARSTLRAALGERAFVDACAVVGGFNVVDRIADATGIPLDASLVALSEDLREQLDLARFESAANTPGARA